MALVVGRYEGLFTRKCFHIPDKEEISLIIEASINMTSSGKQTFISPYNKGIIFESEYIFISPY
jgi:hypothetical protein